ncbi:MAG: hypothetical protein IPL22_22895 [Bacteroidetes bacterium]|nr:hypothetical protein [Bacteroidota bacterium]
MVGTTAMDAFIACWETKDITTVPRPWTLVRHYHKGEKIRGWADRTKGPLKCLQKMASVFSANFVSPPFLPMFPGHSTVSGACAKCWVFTGSDKFGEKEIRKPGIITETGRSCFPLPLTKPFTATADMAGISRVMGDLPHTSRQRCRLKNG